MKPSGHSLLVIMPFICSEIWNERKPFKAICSFNITLVISFHFLNQSLFTEDAKGSCAY